MWEDSDNENVNGKETDGPKKKISNLRVSRAKIKVHQVHFMENVHPIKITSKEGKLEKLSIGIFTVWKTRYCTLNDSIFTCFKEKKGDRISCLIDFKLLEVRLKTEGNMIILELSNGKVFTFKARNEKILQEWIELIVLNISAYEISYKIIPKTLKFWKVS